MTRKHLYPWSWDELPDWLRELPGYDQIIPQLRDSADPENPKAEWQLRMSLPLNAHDDHATVDPLVLLVGLAYGAARLAEKTEELVHVCRKSGKSWTQIGQALGMSKQAAWERFSEED